MSDFKLSIPAKTEYLAMVRRVTEEIALDYTPLAPLVISDLIVAVSEAVANAINAQRAASRGRAGRPVVIDFRISPNAFTIKITDRAKGFDPDNIKPLPDVTDPRRLNYEGGLGIYLYSLYSDAHSVKSSRRGTTVSLTKYFKHPQNRQPT